jgi:hypothetical protein
MLNIYINPAIIYRNARFFLNIKSLKIKVKSLKIKTVFLKIQANNHQLMPKYPRLHEVSPPV